MLRPDISSDWPFFAFVVVLAVVVGAFGYWATSRAYEEPDYPRQSDSVVILPGDDIAPAQIVPMDRGPR